MTCATPDSTETRRLLETLRPGDRRGFERLCERHQEHLRRMVAVRLDPRLRGRIDPEDVLQEVQLEAYRRLEDYLQRAPMPFTFWMRRMVCQQLYDLQRRHLDAQCRSVRREQRLPDRSSFELARQLSINDASPSGAMADKERAQRMQEALAELSEPDREILLMRYVEGLSNREVAWMLDLSPDAASKRHGRALLRLHRVLRRLGWTEGPEP